MPIKRLGAALTDRQRGIELDRLQRIATGTESATEFRVAECSMVHGFELMPQGDGFTREFGTTVPRHRE